MKKRAMEAVIFLIVVAVLALIIFTLTSAGILASLSPYSTATKESKEYSTNIQGAISSLESYFVSKNELTYEEVTYDPYARPYNGKIVETEPRIWKFVISFSGTTGVSGLDTIFGQSSLSFLPSLLNIGNLKSNNCNSPSSNYQIAIPGVSNTKVTVCYDNGNSNYKLEVQPSSGSWNSINFALVCNANNCAKCGSLKDTDIKKIFSDRIEGNYFKLSFDECIELLTNGQLTFTKNVNGNDCKILLVPYYNNNGKDTLFKLYNPSKGSNSNDAYKLISYTIAGYLCESLFRAQKEGLGINIQTSGVNTLRINGKDYKSIGSGTNPYTLKITPSSINDRGQCVILSKWDDGNTNGFINYIFPSSQSKCADSHQLWDNVLAAIKSNLQPNAKETFYWDFISLGNNLESSPSPLSFVKKGYLLQYPLEFILLSPFMCSKFDPNSFIETCPDKVLTYFPKDRKFDVCIICNNYIMMASSKDKAIANILVKDSFTGNIVSLNKVCWINVNDNKCENTLKDLTIRPKTVGNTNFISINQNSEGTIAFLAPTQNTIVCQLTGTYNNKIVNFFFITSENICNALNGNKAKIPLTYLMGKFNKCFLYKIVLKGKPFLVVSNAYSPASNLKLSLPLPKVPTPNLQIKDNYLILNKNCLEITNVEFDVITMDKGYCCVENNGGTLFFQGGMVYPSECNGIWLENNCRFYIG